MTYGLFLTYVAATAVTALLLAIVAAFMAALWEDVKRGRW